jgi:predicted nucleic-acid-binding protein
MPRFVFSEASAIHSAIHFYGESIQDLADLLVLFQARVAGADKLISFDAKLQQFDSVYVSAP